MPNSSPGRSKFTATVLSRIMPSAFVAAQLRKPSGRFGRWVMTRVLNDRNAALIAATVDALQLKPDDCFMDIGFGGGRSLELAAQCTRGPLWGIDFSPDVVVAGTQRLRSLLASGQLHLLSADAADLPLYDALIDAICTTNTIYFWPDPACVLQSFKRVLKPGGRLALGFSGSAKMQKLQRITRHGFRYYDVPEVEALLHAAGFVHIRALAQHGKVNEGEWVVVAES